MKARKMGRILLTISDDTSVKKLVSPKYQTVRDTPAG